MLDPFIEAIKTILANPASRAGPIELCRTRRVRAMGKRVTFRLTEAEDGSRLRARGSSRTGADPSGGLHRSRHIGIPEWASSVG